MPEATTVNEAPASNPAPASPAPAATQAAPAPAKNGAAPTNGAADATLGQDGGGEDTAQTTPAEWPAHWREVMSGGDPKALAKLRRYDSPLNVFKAYRALEQKVGAGELVRSRPEGDENDPAYKTAINEWRAQVGVPEKPEGYLDKVPDGIVIGDDDKPIVESFLQDMHESDMPPVAVHKALQWYYKNQEAQIEQRAIADKANRAKSEDMLRSEWGPEYRANLNGVRSLFETYGSKELLNQLFSARMPDGTPLGDNVGVLQFLSGLSREINPAGGVVTPIEGRSVTETIQTEKSTLEAEMRDNRSDYWTNPSKQARWRELDELEQRHRRKAS